MPYCDFSSFEGKLAYHAAPSLLGIKPASLFSVRTSEYSVEENRRFNQKVCRKGLKLKTMCKCKDRMLIMLYNENVLTKQLQDVEKQTLLSQYGYSEMSVDEMLDRLAKRIEGSENFPHEIGIFLGYPIEDVWGFIQNKGENFKLCGYWKVYGDEEKARRIFNNYNKCRTYLCNKLNQGADIYQALKIS